jgi:hypothetical protein
MKSMYIGSGDTAALLAGKTTKAHTNLLRRFVSDTIPYYNALASPIDAFRIGAILEDRYFLTLPEGWYPQVKMICPEMDCLKASLDFAKVDGGNVVEFREMKTVFFTDFIELERLVDYPDAALKFIKKDYKPYYNQVQQQLLCSGLSSATIVFVCVNDYDDEANTAREIADRDCLEFTIERDDAVIAKIREAAQPFQMLKDYYSSNS